MTRKSVKLWIYSGQALCATAISGLTLGMFGDGTLDWAKFRFAWCLFAISSAVSVLNVIRAALDQETSSTEPATAVMPVKQIPADPPAETPPADKSVANPAE